MVLSRFPNRQLDIMIDVYLIALLYDLELGFHILVYLINQIMIVFFGQVCLVHLSYFSHVSYFIYTTISGASPVWIPHFLVQKCPYTSMFK